MTNDSTPPDDWNPLATIEPETRPLKRSGGRISVTYRRWTGRERLAFEDILTQRMMTKDEAGGDTIKIGTLRLYASTLTIQGSTGFETFGAREGFLSGTPKEIEDDLLSITDEKLRNEIVETAREIQPLPKIGDDDEDSDGGDDDGDDPFPTPSTGETAPTVDAG